MGSIHDVELLTVREVMGLLRMGAMTVYEKLVPSLPPNAIVRSGRGNGRHKRILINSLALYRWLGYDKCPGCGRDWPEGTPTLAIYTQDRRSWPHRDAPKGAK